MSVIDTLAGEFSRLPGVGPKTALRLVHHLMKRPKEDSRRLARAISDVADRIRPLPNVRETSRNTTAVTSAPTLGGTAVSSVS